MIPRRLLAAAAALASLAAGAQQIDPSLGADASVDYEALKRFGPWDDFNYRLTAADLALLAPNEVELTDAIPVFYRVELRRRIPDLPRSGRAQYPRSALPYFFLEYGGYRVGGKLFRGADRDARGRWAVRMNKAVGTRSAEGQVKLEGEVRVTNPAGAAESSIEASPINPDILIAGSNGPGSGQRMHYSFDGGETWNESAPLPLGGTCCDPTIGWSSDGTLAYAAALGGSTNYFWRSSDNGQTWDDLANEPGGDPRREIRAGSFTDKEFLHVDRSPTSPFQDNIYLTWHEGNIMRFARSRDFGNTWDPVISFSSASDKRGIGSDISTDRAGNVYYFWPAFNSRKIWVARSGNGGSSFTPEVEVATTNASFIFPIPSMNVREVFVYVSTDVDNTGGPFADSIYAAWTDSTAPTGGNPANNHARIQFAYSRDGGANWTVTTPHPTADALQVDRWHQWVAVGPDGTVHLMYYNTLGDPSRTSVNVFYTFSSDGGVTWSPEMQITTESSPDIGDTFEFGDYNGLAATMDGVIAIFTDNRNEAGGGADSVDIYAAGPGMGGAPDYTLSDASPGVAGVPNTWNTSNGTPTGGNLLYFGRANGATPISIGNCSTTVNLANARPIAFGQADGAGDAIINRALPAQIDGRTISFQAVDLFACETSNVSTTTF
jgi:hypothetical protein